MSSKKRPAKRRLGKGLSAMLDTTHASNPPKEGTERTTQHAVNKTVVPPAAPVEVKIGEPTDTKQNTTTLTSDRAPSTPVEGDQVNKDTAGAVTRVPLAEIVAGRHQPRKAFDDEALESLAASIRSVGVIQPVTLRRASGGGYELIAGERRCRAARLAGLTDVPAMVVEVNEQIAAETALIENLQREDLNPIERADAIRGLIDAFGYSQSAVAERVGLDRSSVSNLLRLADLEPGIRDLLASGALGLGHGKALLSLDAGPARVDLAEKAVREGWSVRRVEEESRRGKAAPATPGGARASIESGGGDVETRALEKRLGEHLGTKVSLRVDRAGKGTVQIRFFDLDHFDDLMSRIGFDASETTESL